MCPSGRLVAEGCRGGLAPAELDSLQVRRTTLASRACLGGPLGVIARCGALVWRCMLECASCFTNLRIVRMRSCEFSVGVARRAIASRVYLGGPLGVDARRAAFCLFMLHSRCLLKFALAVCAWCVDEFCRGRVASRDGSKGVPRWAPRSCCVAWRVPSALHVCNCMGDEPRVCMFKGSALCALRGGWWPRAAGGAWGPQS